ncbi:unnamed protein product [Pichia kudriavzevii]
MEDVIKDRNVEFDVDDKLCVDCKTRVHFQWIIVDLYQDHMSDIGEVKEENMPQEGDTANFKGYENEWKEIIEKAKNANEEEKGERRTRRRSLRKRRLDHGNDAIGITSVPPEEKEKRDICSSVELLRKENCLFGKCVLCIGCFSKEIGRLTEDELARVLKVSLLVEENV